MQEYIEILGKLLPQIIPWRDLFWRNHLACWDVISHISVTSSELLLMIWQDLWIRLYLTSYSMGAHCSQYNQNQINSLWPGDAPWRHGTRSTLAQVMACCLTAPSHYLNQCWLIVSEVPWDSSQGIILRWCSVRNSVCWSHRPPV